MTAPTFDGNAIIRVRGLRNSFGDQVVHEDLDLDVRPGEILGVVGGSGTGKSVLMRSIIGLQTPVAGEITVFGEPNIGREETEATEIRKRWGVLFQGGALFSTLTVAENVQVPLREFYPDLEGALLDEIAAYKVVMTGLPADAGPKFPAELSGGMKKRAGLARALALDPELLFLDEPTAGLDPIGAAAFDELTASLQKTLGLTVFLITHDLDTLYAICDRVAVLAALNLAHELQLLRDENARQAVALQQTLADLNRRSANFRFHARLAEPNDAPQVIVMVIGESSRYDSWGINGYRRDTTPLLRQEANLVTLPDVITAVSATRLSVPVIISRKPAMQSLKDGFYEKSFLTAYKEAGFKTFWLSNQISFGQFDTPVSVFAKEADVIQFMNLGGFTNNSNFDQILLEPLHLAIADPQPKKLIVLHTLGNHWNYSQRYPKEFDKWQPSLFGVDKPVYTDTKIKPQLNNSYDNSILYTDWFLSQVIHQLKDTQQLTSMVYVADHGQTLAGGERRFQSFGVVQRAQFHEVGAVGSGDGQLARHRAGRGCSGSARPTAPPPTGRPAACAVPIRAAPSRRSSADVRGS